jgi:hypothetical protein
LSEQPCNKSGNFDKVVTSCQQIVPNLLTTCDKQCEYILSNTSYIHEHLKWEENVKNIASSCYSTLATLRKLKNSLPFKIRKNLVQALVLSKLYYNDVIYHSLPEYLQKRLQRVQKAAAGFVLGKFARSADVLSLNWLPIKEQREWNVLKLSYKALYD